MKKLVICISMLFCTILVSGCETIYNPATQRNEIVLINTASEVSLGKIMSKQIGMQYKISKDESLNKRLNAIGTRVASASDRQDLTYQFAVVEDKELNAFAIPGGFIFANSGLIEKANDDELACVLAHETGHVAARHPAKKLQTVLGYQVLMSIVFRNASSATVSQAMDVVFNLISLGYSREDERLADKLSVKYSYKAGFKPEAMIAFFKKLKAENEKSGGSTNLVFLSSHPPIDERIKNVTEEINIIEGKKKIQPEKTQTKQPAGISTLSQAQDKTNTSKNLSQPQENKSGPSRASARKICPKCKSTYPDYYNFCPKDGTNLNIQ